MTKRSYSDREKAETLAILDTNAGNLSLTSEHTGVPIKTLSDWRDNRGVNGDVADFRNEKREELSVRFEQLAHDILNILPSKLRDAKVSELATAAAIAVDKAQLLKGKPTTITETIEQKRRVAEDLIKRFVERDGLTRDVAVAAIIKAKPEAKDWIH